MSEYAQPFAENRIDVSVLPDLTDQDSEELGVVLGDRRKILRAIAKLDDMGVPARPSVSAPPATRMTIRGGQVSPSGVFNRGRLQGKPDHRPT